jgi:hypothetical protein
MSLRKYLLVVCFYTSFIAVLIIAVLATCLHVDLLLQNHGNEITF